MSGWMNLKKFFEKLDPYMHVRPGLNQSQSLLKLSVSVVVKSLTAPIMQLIERKKDSQSSFEEAFKFCYQLQEFFNQNLPGNVIKMVSTDLIYQIGGETKDLQESSTVTLTYMLLLSSVLYQKKIVIDCEALSNFYKEIDACEALQLTRMLYQADSKGFCLEEKCTDWMLKLVLTVCPEVKKIKLKESVRVTDMSFCRMLHLKFLTELQIVGTNLDASSFINAMEAHPISQSLESFTCSHIKTPDLVKLLQSCPKLKHIGLVGYIQRDIFHTEEKHNIRRLTLAYCNYDLIRDVIKELGPTLDVLDMWLMYDVPLMDVVVLCPHLQMLNMCVLIRSFSGSSVADESLFESIEYLSLNIGDKMPFISHAVSCSKNLKGLILHGSNTNALTSLLENCKLTNLEHLSMCSISESTALCMLRHCPKLRMMAGLDLKAMTPTFFTEAKAINPDVIFYGPVPNNSLFNLSIF